MRSKILVGITAALSVTALYLVATEVGQNQGPLSAFLGAGAPIPRQNVHVVVDNTCGPTPGGQCGGDCPAATVCSIRQTTTGSDCACVPMPKPPTDTCGPIGAGVCGGTCITDPSSVCTSKQTDDGSVSCECVPLERCGVTASSTCNPVKCQNPLEHCTALETSIGVDCLCALPIVGEPNPNKVFDCTPTEFGRTRCYRASLPSTCMPGICMQQYYTGMCTGSAEGPCEMKLEDCSSNETCAPKFRFCGDIKESTCGGFCTDKSETCVSTGTSCSCRKMTPTPTTIRR